MVTPVMLCNPPIPTAQSWPFDLSATLSSGQAFHWQPLNDGWVGAIGHTPAFLTADEGTLPAFAQNYLALDHNLPAITATFPQDDAHLRAAVAFCPGLRILRQPKWECLATFITSSLKQVPHIRQISLTLRERLGAALTCQGQTVFAYPTPQAIASAGETVLRQCGLGYRAPFLHRTACAVAEGRMDLEEVAQLPDEEARRSLISLPGVGEKIAHCVLLFAYERLGAFPVDVWVERILRELYFPRHRSLTSKKLRDFTHQHFGPFRGYAQQFLFHYARLTKLRSSR